MRLLQTLSACIQHKLSMALPVSIADTEALSLAVSLLKSGKVVAVPTDTVYGLGCDATNPTAIQELYSIKCRNNLKPVAICLGEVTEIEKWAYVEHIPDGLLKELLPGPVTVILRSRSVLDESVVSGGKIGIRIPNSLFVRKLVRVLGRPLALTSANLSGEASCVSIKEFEHIWGKVSCVFDGGVLNAKREASTVVDLSESGLFSIVRSGVAIGDIIKTLKSYQLRSNFQ